VIIMAEIAVLLVRGLINTRPEIRETLHRLRLTKKNSCVVVQDKPEIIGMINKVKDQITWGEVKADVAAALKKRMTDNVAHLNSPRKGFGRKGIKFQFKTGGALGNRGDKINDLLERMM